ncbi:hypothetical protein L3X38_006456 [Prunus dulcis]|uniref:Uncharacterized protein n=1 Tax=Prunus dulcis TaxID=3755 RepID=A0AAD4ZSY5_PRUDU|nr:hypothetical protein L3X38_006456 [Prunus dulcis]
MKKRKRDINRKFNYLSVKEQGRESRRPQLERKKGASKPRTKQRCSFPSAMYLILYGLNSLRSGLNKMKRPSASASS